MKPSITAGVALALCALLLLPSVAPASSYHEALKDWAYVLESYVDEQGRIDFVSLGKAPEPLQRFVHFINTNGPASDPEKFNSAAEVLAYHINAYNALAMHGVLERDIPKDFSSFFKRASFFKFRRVRVDGQKTNLYDYENQVIRPLGDARVHFALNCMVHACPRLPRTPFVAGELDAQLDSATREFFSNERHIRVDHERKALWLSEILKFYTEDFVPSGRRDDLVAYVNGYLQTAVPEDYRVRFIPYDWTINQQP